MGGAAGDVSDSLVLGAGLRVARARLLAGVGTAVGGGKPQPGGDVLDDHVYGCAEAVAPS